MSRLLGKLTPAKVAHARLHKKVFREFADKIGFVYFGYVDQHQDEHKLVRGLTLSSSVRDDHYTLGTYHGYDTTIVERTDVIKNLGPDQELKNWLIVTVDLHTNRSLPHIFIGLESHTQAFYRHVMTKFSHLQRLHPGAIAPYDPEFILNFTIYTTPTYNVYVEQLLTGELHKQLVAHFPLFSYEIEDTTLYVYCENKRPTEEILSQMLQCSAWFATELDRRVTTL